MSNFDSNSPKKFLYLDVGNSSIKGAFRKGVQWETIHPKTEFTASDLLTWIDSHTNQFDEIIVAGVRKDVLEAIKMNLNSLPLREIKMEHVPLELLDYDTIETLGIDRFLACYGASKQTTESVVVIDAGTATTIDFMSQDDVFHGGVIAPGLTHFMNILPDKAPALPKVDVSLPEKWPGKSTRDSLRWGQTGFYKMALEKMLSQYEQEFGTFELFVAGGNGALIEQMIEREVKLRPFLVFDGMERLVKLINKSEK